jgi:hypothetical protein
MHSLCCAKLRYQMHDLLMKSGMQVERLQDVKLKRARQNRAVRGHT